MAVSTSRVVLPHGHDAVCGRDRCLPVDAIAVAVQHCIGFALQVHMGRSSGGHASDGGVKNVVSCVMLRC